MALGYFAPFSIYCGDASGSLTVAPYIPATNTNLMGPLEAVQVVASLNAVGVDAPAKLQFVVPTPPPSGTAKLRSLFQSTATGTIKYTVSDFVTSPGANPGAQTPTTEPQATVSISAADVLIENKVNLLGVSAGAGQLASVMITFNATGWALTAALSGLHMLVWE